MGGIGVDLILFEFGEGSGCGFFWVDFCGLLVVLGVGFDELLGVFICRDIKGVDVGSKICYVLLVGFEIDSFVIFLLESVIFEYGVLKNLFFLNMVLWVIIRCCREGI